MKIGFALALPLLLTACDGNDLTFTLYRNSLVNLVERVHVATFNADQSARYNRENCDLAAKALSDRPEATVRYWCENGRYRP